MKIVTRRAYIVPFEEDHIPEILEMLQEPDSNRYIRPLQGQSLEQMEARLRENLNKNKVKLQFFAAFDAENNSFIGTLNLNKFENSGLQQLGVHLSRKYWGKRYGFELCESLLTYAQNSLDIKDIHWIFETENEASRKLALKLGFNPDHTIDENGWLLEVYKKERAAL